SVYELAGLWLAVAAIGACFYLPKLRTGFLIVAVAGFVGFTAAAFALSQQVINGQRARLGIVVLSGAAARFAPLPESTVHFPLAEGTAVAIREDRGPWLLVERADGQQGWVKTEAIGRITPAATSSSLGV